MIVIPYRSRRMVSKSMPLMSSHKAWPWDAPIGKSQPQTSTGHLVLLIEGRKFTLHWLSILYKFFPRGQSVTRAVKRNVHHWLKRRQINSSTDKQHWVGCFSGIRLASLWTNMGAVKNCEWCSHAFWISKADFVFVFHHVVFFVFFGGS